MAELAPTFVAETQYQADDYRTAYTGLQEGVEGAGDLKVTVNAGQVDVAAGVVFIQGDALADQGLIRGRNDAAKNSGAFAAGGIPAAGANPRVHQIIARAYEHESDGLGLRIWRLEVVAGTAAAGATLDNRSGAGALPASACRLADVHQTAAGVLTARDRRPWARGAHRLIERTSGDITAGTGYIALDPAVLAPRIECSGAPVELSLRGRWAHDTGGMLHLRPNIDNAPLGGQGDVFADRNDSGVDEHVFAPAWRFTPSAGSHIIGWAFRTAAGNGRIRSTATEPLQMVVQEIVRQNADNT